jgi:hypothetical protein
MRRAAALVLCALVGLAAGCGSGKNGSSPGGKVPPPHPTTGGKTGTPTGPTNTAHTTTSAPAG